MPDPKFYEMLEKLQSLNLKQTYSWEDDIPEEVYYTYLSDHKYVASNLDVDKHRWYEFSTQVIEVHGGYLGINCVSNVFSEDMGISDVGAEYKFMEMEPIVTTTYVPKA
jgi:hypothetical protein